jgi:hypothetical protein
MNAGRFALGLWILLLVLCSCKSQTDLYVNHHGKVDIHPEDGNVLHWKNTKAVFIGATPCKGHETELNYKTSDCEVVVPDVMQPGRYMYTCEKCKDPEIITGSETEPLEDLLRGKGKEPDVTVAIPCDVNMNKIVPSFYTNEVKKGQVIEWQSNGTGKTWVLPWNVVFDNPMVCQEGGTIKSDGYGDGICTVNVDTPMEYAYTVKSTANPATCGDGTSSVKVVP